MLAVIIIFLNFRIILNINRKCSRRCNKRRRRTHPRLIFSSRSTKKTIRSISNSHSICTSPKPPAYSSVPNTTNLHSKTTKWLSQHPKISPVKNQSRKMAIQLLSTPTIIHICQLHSRQRRYRSGRRQEMIINFCTKSVRVDLVASGRFSRRRTTMYTQ